VQNSSAALSITEILNKCTISGNIMQCTPMYTEFAEQILILLPVLFLTG